MLTGLAHAWVHVGAPRGALGLRREQRESGCCAMGHRRTCCLFPPGARVGPVFLLSCNAGSSLLDIYPFWGDLRVP